MGRAKKELLDINIFKLAGDDDLWFKFRQTWENLIDEEIELRAFLEKHLRSNLENFNLSADCQNEIPKRFQSSIHNTYQDPNFAFYIAIEFTERKDHLNSLRLQVKFNKERTKVLNREELSNFMVDALIRTSYEIGFMEAYLSRIDLDIRLIRNDRDHIIIKEDVVSNLPQKAKYEITLSQVKSNVRRHSELHKYEDYIKNRFELISDSEYIEFLRGAIGRNKIKYKTIEKSLERFRKN